MDGPDVNTGRPFRLSRNVLQLRLLGVEPSVDQPARAFVGERKGGQKAFASRRHDIETIAPCDRPEDIGIMIDYGEDRLVRRQAGDVLSRRINEGFDSRRVDGKNHSASSEFERGHWGVSWL